MLNCQTVYVHLAVHLIIACTTNGIGILNHLEHIVQNNGRTLDNFQWCRVLLRKRNKLNGK